MRKGFINLNDIPTNIRTWGRWIEESGSKPNDEIVMCIPGNPGLTGYYHYFLETIHNKLGCPVWAVGHAGHQEPDGTAMKVPDLEGNENLFNVEAQIENKVEFFKKYVPEGTKVHLIGHSIGAYVILRLLKYPEINSKIEKCYLLFPTLEHMDETPNGKLFTNFMKYVTWIIFFASWIFTLFPHMLQTILVYGYFVITSVNKSFVPTTLDLIKPSILKRVFFMAFDEIKYVKDLDKTTLNANKHKIRLYYAVNDRWAPSSYCKRLQKDYPDINAEICVRNFDHAYILRHSKEVGNMVADWITLENQ